MSIEQTSQSEVEDFKRWYDRQKEESPYKKHVGRKIELINWALNNMKNPNIQICELMESKLNEVILKINQTHDIFESDRLHGELRILDWIFYQVCGNEIKKL